MKLINELTVRVNAFDTVFEEQQQIQDISLRVTRLSSDLNTVRELIDTGSHRPLIQLWSKMRDHSDNDIVLLLALDSVPRNVLSQGVASTKQIKHRFKRVEKAVRTASFVPPKSGMLGEALGVIFNFLAISQHTFVSGNSDHSILSRAGYYLDRGDLVKCLHELESLSPSTRTVASDYVNELRGRINVNVAIESLGAQISVLSSSLTQS